MSRRYVKLNYGAPIAQILREAGADEPDSPICSGHNTLRHALPLSGAEPQIVTNFKKSFEFMLNVEILYDLKFFLKMKY